MRHLKYLLATAVYQEHVALVEWAKAPYVEDPEESHEGWLAPAMAHSAACDYVDRESAAREAVGIPGVRQ
jgi:hypothetical protein